MKKIQIALIAIVLLAVALMLALQSDWARQLAQKFLKDALSESGYKVEIGKFEGTLPHAIDLQDVRIESETLNITIKSLETRISLLALLKKELLFTDVLATGVTYEIKPGRAPTFGKGKGLSFSVRVKHFQLDDVAIDGAAFNFQGALRLGKRNSDFYLDVAAARPGFPDFAAKVTAYLDEAGGLRFKGSLKSPTLKALPLDFPIDGVGGDAGLDVQFSLRGKSQFYGHVSGKVSPHSIPTLPFAPWLERDWTLDSRIALKSKTWEVSRFVAKAGADTISGSAKFFRSGKFDEGSFAVKSHEPQGALKFEMKETPEGLAVKGNGNAAKIQVDGLLLNNVQAHAEFLWKESAMKGNMLAAAAVEGKTWKGKTDFAWENGGSLSLTGASLQSPFASAAGNVEIRKDKILIGQTAVDIENLQDLPFGLYGKLQGKVDWLVLNGKQVMTADLTGAGVYWKDLFAGKVKIDASIIDPFDHPKGRVEILAEEAKWKQMFLDRLQAESLIGGENWPFAVAASGTWKRPLELNLSGTWHYGASLFTATVRTAAGSFYNHPLALKKEVEFQFAPNRFLVSGLDLAFSEGRGFFLINETENDLSAELILEKFPLDILSLNPLEVSIAGTTDLTLSVHQKNGKVEGSLKAAVHQMEVAAVDETPPLPASGNLSGRFDRERLELDGAFEIQGSPLLSLNLSIPIAVELMPLRAHLVYDQKAEGHLALKGRIEEILDFFDLGTHRIEGDVTGDLTLKNTLLEPQIKGSVHFENGKYENYLTGTRLLNIRADGHASGDQFTLDTFTGSVGAGTLTAGGVIAFLPKEGFPFRFEISFTRFQIAQIDLVSAEAEGKISVEGNLKAANAKGSLQIVESDLQIPDRLPKTLPNLVVVYRNAVKPIPEPPLIKKEPYPLHLDLEVSAPEAIRISGRGLDSEWKGNFHLGGTYTALQAEGKLELLKGEFLFSGRRFKLQEGALIFTGKENEMPYLNLAAQMEVKEISITARLKGPLNQPQLTLQSVPPLPLGTIMSYLLFGQELAEINSFQAFQLANSLASLAGVGPDVLENTRRALGVDRLNIVTLPSGEPGVEDTIALQVGKYISEGVLVSLTQGAEESSTNINIEIELKGGWVVQLESDQRQEQGKFTIKWNHNY
jgi:TamB, inner membrane protein subunit of TAM complex